MDIPGGVSIKRSCFDETKAGFETFLIGGAQKAVGPARIDSYLLLGSLKMSNLNGNLL
jgi:hypothetical protein